MAEVSDSSLVLVDVLDDVLGAEGKVNTVICARNGASSCASEGAKTVAFFPGDAQDLEEKMLKHRDNRYHAAWCLEKVVRLIYNKFQLSDPQSLWRILIIQPKERRLGTFAVYSNFLAVDDSGNPKMDDTSGGENKLTTPCAWNHLECLLKSMDERFPLQLTTKHELKIVGFSKGCVVVNELVREASHCGEVDLLDCFKKLTDIYLLDGGHNGGKMTWLANGDDVIPFLKKTATRVHLHVSVTPYQVSDPRRPWNGKECNRFIRNIQQFLRQSNYDEATKSRLLKFVHHFTEETPSLENHFRVLEAFEV